VPLAPDYYRLRPDRFQKPVRFIPGGNEMSEETKYSLEQAHLYFAKSLNGEVWSLLDKENRSREQDEHMLAAAFGSYYHWFQIGNQANRQRGEYLIARVYLELGNTSEALAHAQRCLELTNQFRDHMQDFDQAFALEMFARTNAAANKNEVAREYYNRAKKAGQKIADEEDRQIFFADFNAGNWFGLEKEQ
jgi:tetratricopeptide (TPR) repeat protein